MDPASMNPEQLTSKPTKQDLLNEEIQKLAMKTHLEVQQREGIRRDLAERMKFVPPDSSSRGKCILLARRSEQNAARKEIWKMVEGGDYCCQGPVFFSSLRFTGSLDGGLGMIGRFGDFIITRFFVNTFSCVSRRFSPRPVLVAAVVSGSVIIYLSLHVMVVVLWLVWGLLVLTVVLVLFLFFRLS